MPDGSAHPVSVVLRQLAFEFGQVAFLPSILIVSYDIFLLCKKMFMNFLTRASEFPHSIVMLNSHCVFYLLLQS